MTPEIIFKDDNIIVLNKPSGMIVNNADTSKNVFTLQDFLRENSAIEKNGGEEFLSRGGVVHRLDKETSGVIIAALNEKSFYFLQSQFKDRSVKKRYIALCHGEMPQEGYINAPIGRLPWNRMRFGVVPDGRNAYTEFSLIRKYKLIDGKKEDVLSLVEVMPKTGRTHQIRVHFQYIGHPIFSDELYAGRKTALSDRKKLPRHFLHASKLFIKIPNVEDAMEFEAELSDELKKFLESLKKLG